MLVIEDILGRCAPLLGIDPTELRRRNFYREGQTTPVRPAGPPPRARRALLGPGARRRATSTGAGRDRAQFNAAPRAHQAGPRHHAGEVRHLVQLHRVQPGRRARARLQGRLGAHQPRWHRDGPGPAHQDAAGRGDDAGVPLSTRAARADPHRQGAQHLGHRGQLRRRPQRRRRQERLRADPRPAARRWPPGGSACTRPTCCFSDGRVRAGRWRRDRVVGRARGRRPTSSGSSSGRRASTAPRACTGTPRSMQGSPFKYFSYGVAAAEVEVDGFTGAYRLRRVDIVHDVGDSLSPLVDIGQVEGAFVQGAGWLTLEDLRWDESDGPSRGRLATQVGQHLQAAELLRDARGLQRRAARARPRGRRRLRLARQSASRRSCWRSRCARRCARPPRRSGPAGTRVDLASPATPEAVFWAVEEARGGAEPPDMKAMVEGAPGLVPDQPGADARPLAPRSERATRPTHGPAPPGPDVEWLAAVERLRRDRRPGVLVTLATVRGHVAARGRRQDGRQRRRHLGQRSVAATSRRPRSTGPARCCGTRPTGRSSSTLALNDKAPVEHGQQCCGGEVSLLLEPLAVVPRRRDLRHGPRRPRARPILARHDLELHLVDSRADQLARDRLAVLDDAVGPRARPPRTGARARPGRGAARHPRAHHDPRPRRGRGPLRRGPAVRTPGLDRPHRLVREVAQVRATPCRRRPFAPGPCDRIHTPIGLSDIAGKEPATIAVSVAADLIRVFESEHAGHQVRS